MGVRDFSSRIDLTPSAPTPSARSQTPSASHHLTKADPEKHAGLDHYAILSVPLVPVTQNLYVRRRFFSCGFIR